MTKSEAEKIKLSKRIQMYKAYEDHPLLRQYLKEKEKLKKDLAVQYQKEIKECKKRNRWKFIPFLLILVYLGLFVLADGMYTLNIIVVIIVLLGILNLIMCGVAIFSDDANDEIIKDSKEYKEFTERYENLGLVEVTEYNLTVGDCVEYDNVKCGYVCGATGCPLTYEQIRACRSMSRNDCSKFYGAVYGANALENAMRRGEFKQ